MATKQEAIERVRSDYTNNLIRYIKERNSIFLSGPNFYPRDWQAFTHRDNFEIGIENLESRFDLDSVIMTDKIGEYWEYTDSGYGKKRGHSHPGKSIVDHLKDIEDIFETFNRNYTEEPIYTKYHKFREGMKFYVVGRNGGLEKHQFHMDFFKEEVRKTRPKSFSSYGLYDEIRIEGPTFMSKKLGKGTITRLLGLHDDLSNGNPWTTFDKYLRERSR
tara:strand:- start:135 stop:788 length:654 start_codon:yes stop_codon:yes gene_type:complete